MKLEASMYKGKKLFLSFNRDNVKVSVMFTQLETEKISRVLE